jgi:hypothetical protein
VQLTDLMKFDHEQGTVSCVVSFEGPNERGELINFVYGVWSGKGPTTTEHASLSNNSESKFIWMRFLNSDTSAKFWRAIYHCG